MNNITEAAPAPKLSARIRSLAPKYLEQRYLEVQSLEDLLTSGNFEQIVFIAHKMNGSATGYGFPELSSLACELEEAAEHRNKEAMDIHSKALLGAVVRARSRLSVEQ